MPPGPKYLILESQNNKDLSQDELDALADQIRTQLVQRDSIDLLVVAIAHTAAGVGNHWSDVLNVFLPSGDGIKDAIWAMVIDQIKTMMLARFSRPHQGRRPRVIVVRDVETGEVLRVLQATGPSGEFEELDIDLVDSRRPPPLRLLPRD